MKLLIPLLIPLIAMAADTPLGKPLTLKEPISIEKLLSSPKEFAGRTVQVTGKVTAVCEKMGCWMKLADTAGNAVRIKVKDGEMEFPKDAIGKVATAEGTFEQVNEGAWQIRGTGAVVRE